MIKSFKTYFTENTQVHQLERLLNRIDGDIEQAKRAQQALEPEQVEHLKNQIGQLYDMVVNTGGRIPAHLQGDAGDTPRHISTLRDLRDMEQLNGESHDMLDAMLNMFTEQQDDTKTNPFLKPSWAKTRDKAQADKQRKDVEAAFERPPTDNNTKANNKEIAKR